MRVTPLAYNELTDPLVNYVILTSAGAADMTIRSQWGTGWSSSTTCLPAIASATSNVS
jgi:hypothetical protein